MASASTFARRYDALFAEPRIRALYGESGYFNVGYWADGTDDLIAACDRLVDQVASVVPEDARVILDVGCGLGAGTRRLGRRFPRALVAGVNLSTWQLTQALARGVRGVCAADATHLAIGAGTVDAVLAIESAEHFDTREDFFREAHRVLRPGGVIGLADMIFHAGDAISEQMLLPRQRVSTIPDYAASLQNAGFTDVRAEDVTRLTWTPYCRAMARGFDGHEHALRRIEESLSHYVLVSARRG